jgi:hypothetical protein
MATRSSALTLLAASALAAATLGALVSSGTAQIRSDLKIKGVPSRTFQTLPTAATVRIELTSFTCLNADEDAYYSNGDEPFLMPIAVFVDGTTVNLQQMSTAKCRTMRAPRIHGNLNRKNVKAGDHFSIPADTGVFETVLRPINTGGTPAPDAATLAGILVIAAEEDQTSGALVADAYKSIIAKLEEAINLELQKMGRANIAAIQETLQTLMRDRVNFRTIVNFNFPGLADPNDFIGAAYAQTSLINLRRSDGSLTPQGFSLRFDTPDKRCSYLVRGQFSIPPPPRRSTVRVVVHRVTAIDDLEGIGRGEPDFYARVSIDRVPKDSPVKTGNTIRPEWVFERTTNTNPVALQIELFEDDSVNTDERCDIDPAENSRALVFLIDTSKTRNQSLVNGQRMVRRGGKDKNKCEIEFTVSWN